MKSPTLINLDGCAEITIREFTLKVNSRQPIETAVERLQQSINIHPEELLKVRVQIGEALKLEVNELQFISATIRRGQNFDTTVQLITK
jgi:hypothetical protein